MLKESLKILVVVAFVGIPISCKKSEIQSPASNDVRDGVYAVAQEMYLWNDKLPSIEVFKPTSFETPEAVIQKTRTYSPVGLAGTNLDRWSFAIPKKDWDNFASGNNGDFGCGFRFLNDTDLRISYTYKNSSAGQQGISRSWRVLKINNIDATMVNINELNNQLAQSSVTMQMELPNGSTKTLTITRQNYQINPVLLHKIIEISGKKIGYLVWNSFFGDTAPADIEEAFAYFKANQINELVIDLRYNGGGYISLAEQLARLIAPSQARGKMMYKSQHNANLTSWNKTQLFSDAVPTNAISLSKVVFITTRSTASASELLINVLRPYMTVKIIGNDTYGKPAGYYPTPVIDYYALALAVKQINADGYGEFYEGLATDKKQIDDLTHDFGDPSESCLQDAINYLITGVLQHSDPQANQRIASLSTVNQLLDHEPKLAIAQRK